MTEPAANVTTVIGSSAFANLWTAIVRTYVPIVVGVVAAILLKLKIHYTGDLVPIVTGAFNMVYYTVFKLLEHFKSSKWGVMLGKAAAPVYPTDANP